MKFIEARWHGSGGNSNPTRIVIHDAEYPERLNAAVDVARYFQHVDRKASAHYVCDAQETVQCVKGGDVAYHAPPNARSIGIELIGYAKQTTKDWLDDYGVAMLKYQAAPLVRDLCATYGIPRMWLSVADLKAGRSGITSHNNVSLAFGQSTHTDPGGGFPIDQFMQWVIGPPAVPDPPQEDDMPLIIADNNDADNEHGQVLEFGGKSYKLRKGEDSSGLQAAGVKLAKVSRDLFDAINADAI